MNDILNMNESFFYIQNLIFFVVF